MGPSPILMILVSGTSFKDPSICSKRWITLLKATQLFDFIIKIGEGPPCVARFPSTFFPLFS